MVAGFANSPASSGLGSLALLPNRFRKALAGCLNRGIQLCQGRPTMDARRRHRLVKLIREVQDHSSLASYSDKELLATIQGLRLDIEQLGEFKWEEHVAPVFAIVDECIRRRLGVWRLFDKPDLLGSILGTLEPRNSHSPSTRLGQDEETVLAAVEQARKVPQGRLGRDLSLPAGFYQAARRLDTAGVLLFRPTDEQLLAGLLLFEGKIVEMQAGEGKTVAIAFAAVMHAIASRSVHVLTANDYLAERDCRLLAPLYRSLGLSTDVILEQSDQQERKAAYRCSIVYGTLREFGFDFLRDNLAYRTADQVQQQLDAAVVDEADQALIDEAATPLIIAGEPTASFLSLKRVNAAIEEMQKCQAAVGQEYLAKLNDLTPEQASFSVVLCQAAMALPKDRDVRRLVRTYPRSHRQGMGRVYSEGLDAPDEIWTRDLYYVVDPRERFVSLTTRGILFLEARLGDFSGATELAHPAAVEQNLLSRKNARCLALANQIYQSLRARVLLERGIDYLVTDGSVVLLDRHTGRFRPDSSYQDGLQAALEARENVAIQPDGSNLAQLSAQGFASRYLKLSGITGTALPATEEFRRLYGLSTVAVPTSAPQRRVSLRSRLYPDDEAQLTALVSNVAWCQEFGRPTLVGVSSVEQAAKIGGLLANAGIGHQVLSAVQSREEAEIVRRAGNFAAVTVATNIAGRGTDIILDPDLDRQVAARCVELITSKLRRDCSQIITQCNTEEEATILLKALSKSAVLTANRIAGPHAIEVVVTSRHSNSIAGTEKRLIQRVEFGLGLHVISTEFSRFPRVATQLRGRSGRQGSFGSTLSLLSAEDLHLFPLHRKFPRFQKYGVSRQAGPSYVAGRALEKHVSRVEGEAEMEASVRRSTSYDYGAVWDAHAAEYYRRRQQFLSAGGVLGNLRSMAHQCAARLVNRHFPMLDAGDYDQKFIRLAESVIDSYRLDISKMQGLALDNLSDKLAALMFDSLQVIIDHLPQETSDQFADQLFLECSDEAWRTHQVNLRRTVFGAVAGTYGHKSAVADYIIHAAHLWDQFQETATDLFLSKLLTMPAGVPVKEGRNEALSAQSDQVIALLRGQSGGHRPGRAEVAA